MAKRNCAEENNEILREIREMQKQTKDDFKELRIDINNIHSAFSELKEKFAVNDLMTKKLDKTVYGNGVPGLKETVGKIVSGLQLSKILLTLGFAGVACLAIFL